MRTKYKHILFLARHFTRHVKQKQSYRVCQDICETRVKRTNGVWQDVCETPSNTYVLARPVRKQNISPYGFWQDKYEQPQNTYGIWHDIYGTTYKRIWLLANHLRTTYKHIWFGGKTVTESLYTPMFFVRHIRNNL